MDYGKIIGWFAPLFVGGWITYKFWLQRQRSKSQRAADRQEWSKRIDLVKTVLESIQRGPKFFEFATFNTLREDKPVFVNDAIRRVFDEFLEVLEHAGLVAFTLCDSAEVPEWQFIIESVEEKYYRLRRLIAEFTDFSEKV